MEAAATLAAAPAFASRALRMRAPIPTSTSGASIRQSMVSGSHDESSRGFTYTAPRGPDLSNVVGVGRGLSVGDRLPSEDWQLVVWRATVTELESLS